MLYVVYGGLVFFFKQKTAYEMRISDWSSDVCSSDLWPKDTPVTVQSLANWMISVSDNSATDTLIHLLGRKNIEARMRAAGHSAVSRNVPLQIGRASCRERVCQYV